MAPGLRLTSVLSLVALLAACGGTREAPVRSPTRDYPPPPPTTTDGRGVGADGVYPADRLQEGPRVGTEQELGPGWRLDEEKRPRFDPDRRGGGAVEGEGTEPTGGSHGAGSVGH